jgi:hypothetical protein
MDAAPKMGAFLIRRDYMEDDKAATIVQEPEVTQGFEAAAEAAEKSAEPAATKEGAVTGEGTEEPKVPSTYEEYEQSERFSTAMAERKAAFIEEARPEIHREAKSAAMREFDSSHQRAEAHLSDLAKTGQGMGRSLRDAIESVGEGGDVRQMQRSIQRVIDDNPGFIDVVNSSMYGQGQDAALRRLADESGDPNLLPDVYLRLKNDPGLGDRGFAREILDRLTEARMGGRIKEAIEKAVKPKDEEIAKLTAQLNQTKGKSRTEGPEKLPGSAGGTTDLNKARQDYIDGSITTAEAEKLGIV